METNDSLTSSKLLEKRLSETLPGHGLFLVPNFSPPYPVESDEVVLVQRNGVLIPCFVSDIQSPLDNCKIGGRVLHIDGNGGSNGRGLYCGLCYVNDIGELYMTGWQRSQTVV